VGSAIAAVFAAVWAASTWAPSPVRPWARLLVGVLTDADVHLTALVTLGVGVGIAALGAALEGLRHRSSNHVEPRRDATRADSAAGAATPTAAVAAPVPSR